jgi:hypothetical protein
MALSVCNILLFVGKNKFPEEIVSVELVTSPGMNGQKPPIETGFPVPTSGTVGYGKT